MADFKHSSSTPQGRMSTSRDAQDQGTSGPASCEVCEPQKLGSESIANFTQGPGVSPNRSKIH